MIITQTPLRISFLGGGTDYPEYFGRHGGRTLVTTIDRYVYVTVSPLTPFFGHRIGLHYSKVERVRSPAELEHPAVRECLLHLGIGEGVEIHIASDLPARTGLGSSSCFTVGLLNALREHLGQRADPEALAREAVYVERERIHERVGCQDQYACALGGLRHLRFRPDGQVETERLAVAPDRLQALRDHLLLVYTGIQRHAHEILAEQVARTAAGEADAVLAQMATAVDEAVALLAAPDADLRGFGELLHRGWELKRQCSQQVSTPAIDAWYATARRHGAIGGKLLGAGGGGFLLLFAEPHRHPDVMAALAPLQVVPFAFESAGSRLIFRHP